MSTFINPCHMISHDWLKANGDAVSEREAAAHQPKSEGMVAVCWLYVKDCVNRTVLDPDLTVISTASYESAVIILNANDFEIVEEFTPDEKTWYLVDTKKVRDEVLQNLKNHFETWWH